MIGRLKFDIAVVVNKALDQLPPEIWASDTTTFLDSAIGGGQFVTEVERRLRSAGHSDKNIAQRVYGFESNQMRVNYAINKHKLVGNYQALDFLETDVAKDFDVIVGNSPYLKRTWLKFVKKWISMDPAFIVSVNPDPTNNISNFGKEWKKLCIDNGLIYRSDVTSYFPNVSSGRISGFVFDRKGKANEELLKSNSPLYESIAEKIITENPTAIAFRGRQNISGVGDRSKAIELSEKRQKDFTVPCIMKCTKDGLTIKYAKENVMGKNKIDANVVIINRFFGKNNPDPAVLVEDFSKYNLGYDCLAFVLNDGESLEGFMSVYGSKPYKFMMNQMRNGGFDLSQGNLMALRRQDLSKIWTDQELYKHFGLTTEEIQYIEETTK